MPHCELSPSSSSRWMNCAGSPNLIAAAVIAANIVNEYTTSRAAAEGTVAHSIGEDCLSAASKPAADFLGEKYTQDGYNFTVCEEMVAAVQIYVDYVRSLVVDDECLMDVEVRCCLKELGIEGLEGGTSDVLVADFNQKILHVVDYKHGAGVKVFPENNTQASQYALGALMRYETDGIDVSDWKVHITIVQPRTDWDRPIETWETTCDNIYKWCNEELIPAAEATKQIDAPLVPGDKQCRFCPAAGVCPALYKQTQETAVVDFDSVADEGLAESPDINMLTTEQKVKLLDHSKMITKFLASVKKQVALEIIEGSREYEGTYKLVEGRATRVLSEKGSDPICSPLLEYIPFDKLFIEKPKGIGEIETAVKEKLKADGVKGFGKKAKEIVTENCNLKTGGITLASAEDKRPAIENPAEIDFKDLGE